MIEQEEKQRKRSKRHRMKRNNISDRSRVDAVKEFGVWARAAWAKYKAKYPEKKMSYL